MERKEPRRAPPAAQKKPPFRYEPDAAARPPRRRSRARADAATAADPDVVRALHAVCFCRRTELLRRSKFARKLERHAWTELMDYLLTLEQPKVR